LKESQTKSPIFKCSSERRCLDEMYSNMFVTSNERGYKLCLPKRYG